MSCGCGTVGFTGGYCGTCGCQPCSCNYNVFIGEQGSSSAITGAANINLAGIGFWDSLSGTTLQFRGAESASAALTIALNNTNHTLVFTLDIAAIAAAIPQATTVLAGIGETATNAEAQAKASITAFLTPSNLAALGSSDTFAGLVELATDAEAITGTSTTLALTPANLAAAIAANYGTTTTFSDSVTRAAQAPEFEGQFAAQLDTNTAWLSFGVGAGNWNSVFTFGVVSNEATGNTTTQMNNFSLTFVGNGSFILSNTLFSVNGALSLFDGSSTIFGGSSTQIVDFNQTALQIGGVDVPAGSVLITAGLGAIDSSAIANFVSNANTQTYNISNAVTTRTFDAAAATLQQTKDTLATVIQDLQATQKPTV